MAEGLHDAPGHGCTDAYCAARDDRGGIRLNGGAGLLVADHDHTITDVQGWFDRSRPGRYREQYRAALRLIHREQGQDDTRPAHADEAQGDLPVVNAHTRYVWDCDGCGSVNELEHDPAGEVVSCDECGAKFRIGETR